MTRGVLNLPAYPVAGAIETVAVDPFNSNIVYVGTVGGGLWKTENYSPDAGDGVDNDADQLTDQEDPSERLVWTPLTEQFPTTGYTEIAFDLSDTSGDTFYVGTGKVSSSAINGPGFGLLKTTDGGATWEVIADKKLVGKNITGIIVDGANLYVSVSQTTDFRVGGLLISSDGGATFDYASDTGVGLPAGGVSSIALDRDAGILYAGLPEQGVWSSADGGATWTASYEFIAQSDPWASNSRDIRGIDRVLVSVSDATVADGSADNGNRPVFIGLVAQAVSSLGQSALATDTVIQVRSPERFQPGDGVSIIQALALNTTFIFATADNSITRVDGDWADDGFSAGQGISVRNTSGNDTGYTVLLISGDGKKLFLDSSTPVITDETTAIKDGVQIGTSGIQTTATIDWIDSNTGDIHLTAALGTAFASNARVFDGSEHRLTDVLRSKDEGQSWVDLGQPGSLETTFQDSGGTTRSVFFSVHPGGQAKSHTSLLPDPLDWQNVYVGGDTNRLSGVQTPTSGNAGVQGRLFLWNGSNWEHLTGSSANNTAPHPDSRNMVVYETGPSTFVILQVDDGGIYQLNDPQTQGSRSWGSLIGNLNLTEFYSTSWGSIDNLVVGGAQDNGSALQARAGPGGEWSSINGGDGAITGAFGDRYYTTSQRFGSFGVLAPLLTVADTLTFLPGATVETGNAAATGSITRTTGSFIGDGFRAGRIIIITGSGGYDDVYEISAIQGDGLAMDLERRNVPAPLGGDPRNNVSFSMFIPRPTAVSIGNAPAKQNTDLLSFVDNVATGTITRSPNGALPIGDWLAEGFATGQQIVVIGSGANDAIYSVTAVSSTQLTVDFSTTVPGPNSFAAQTNLAGVQVQVATTTLDAIDTRAGVANDSEYDFIAPYAVNGKTEGRLLIAKGEYLFESFDDGLTVTLLNGQLQVQTQGTPTTADDTYSVPTSARIGNVNAIIAGEGPFGTVAEANIAWVGVEKGEGGVELWVRGTSGTTLSPVLFSKQFPGVRDVAINPSDWAEVYVLDTKGHIWFSDTAGTDPANGTFVDITDNLENLDDETDLQTITVVEAVGSTTPVVLVGGADGVYRHIGNAAGGTWTEFGADLPNVIVSDLSYSKIDDVLLAATVGRGAWTIDKASWVVGSTPQLLLNGTSGNDIFDLGRDASEPWLLNVSQYLDTDTPPLVPQLQVNLRGLQEIVITGGLGDDEINVDQGIAPLVVTGAVSITGDGGTDTLTIANPGALSPYVDIESSSFVAPGSGPGFLNVAAVSPFGVTESQRLDWTGVENVSITTLLAPSMDGIGAGLTALADSLSGGVLGNALASEVLAGLALESLDSALNSFLTDVPRTKDEAFFEILGINPDGSAQLQNRGTLIERLLSEGPNGFSLADIGEDASITTLVELEAALVALGATVVRDESTDRDGDLIADWFLDVQLQQDLRGFVDLGVADSAGIELDGLLGVEMTVQLDLAFGFDGSGFFIDTSDTGADLQVLDMHIVDGATASGRIGFLGVELVDADLTWDPDVSIDFDFNDPASGVADNLIRVSELQSTEYADSVDATVNNDPGDGTPDVQLDGVFSVRAIAPGFEDGISLADSGIRLSWDDLAQPQAVTAVATLQAGPDGQAILDFLQYNSAELIDALTQLKAQLSKFDQVAPPFLAEGLGTLIDLVTAFQQDVIDPLNNPLSGRASVPTVQELAAELAGSLGLSLEELGLAYDPATQELTFNIRVLEGFEDQVKDIRYGIDIDGGVSDLVIDTSASVTFEGGLDFTLGVDIGDVLDGDTPDDYLFVRDAAAVGTIELENFTFDAAARFGFASIGVVGGTGETAPLVNSNPTDAPNFTTTLSDPATNAVDGRIDLVEFADITSENFDASFDGAARFTLPISLDLPGLAPVDPTQPGTDSTIEVLLLDIDDPDTWSVSPEPLPVDLGELPNFNNIDAAGVVSMLARFRDALNELVAGDPFDAAEIPLAGPVIEEIVNLADGIGDALLFDDADDDKDNEDFLITDLNDALQAAGLSGRLYAEATGGKIKLVATDPTIQSLQIVSSAVIPGVGAFGSGPFSQLGFGNGQNVDVSDLDFDDLSLKLTANNPPSGSDPEGATLTGSIDFVLYVSTQSGTETLGISLAQSTNAGLGNDTVKLVDENNQATFKTTQQMVLRLAETLGLSPAAIGGQYNPATQQLTYSLTLNDDLLGVELPVDFNFELGSVAQVSSNSTIRLDATAGLSLVLGIDLSDAGAASFVDDLTPLTNIYQDPGSNPLIKLQPAVTTNTVFGRLSDDVNFSLAINGGAPTPVSITKLDAANNTTPDDLAADLNAALVAAGLDTQLVASADARQLLVTAIDPSITSLSISAASSEAAFRELGFASGQQGGLEDFQLVLRAASSLATGLDALTTTASFDIDFGNTGVPANDVTITVAAPAADDPARDDLQLAVVINNRIAETSLAGEIEASIAGGRLVLTSLNGTGFTVNDADAEAIDKLGFSASDAVADNADLVIYLSDASQVSVSLDGALSLGDVIAAINAQTGGDVTAAVNTAGTSLQLTDNTFVADPDGGAQAGQQRFRIEQVNGSRAALRLGIGVVDAEQRKDRTGSLEGNKLGGVPVEERIYFENVSVGADISLTTPSPDPGAPEPPPGIDATATFGFVGIDLTGDASILAELDFALQEPSTTTPDGRLTVKELLEGLVQDPASLVTTPTLAATGTVNLDLAINPSLNLGNFTVGSAPSLAVQIDSFGDPFNAIAPTLSVTGLGDYDVGDPLTSDVKVSFSDLGDLSLFANDQFKFDNILDALRAIASFLRSFEGAGFLGDELPLIGVSIQDLLGYADRLDALIDEVLNNPAASLQFLESELKEAFGLPQDSTAIGLSVVAEDRGNGDPADDVNMLRVDLGLVAAFSEALNVDLIVPPVLGDSLVGSAGLQANGNVDFSLDFGIDLDAPGDIYLFDSTALTGLFTGTGDNLTFRAALGGFGLIIRGSDSRPSQASIDVTNFGVSLDPSVFTDGIVRILQGGTPTNAIDFVNDVNPTLTGTVSADLPVYFPTDSNYRGKFDFDADLLTFLQNPDPTLYFSETPDLNLDFSEFGLLDNILLAIDGLDTFLGALQSALDSRWAQLNLPIVGDQLAEGVQFIADLRNDFIAPLREAIENADDPDENLISSLIFEFLGPEGAGLLLKSDGSQANSISDIGFVTNINDGGPEADHFAEWDFKLGASLIDTGADINLDLGLPGLGFEADAEVDLALDWEWDFGFGLNRPDVFYFRHRQRGRRR